MGDSMHINRRFKTHTRFEVPMFARCNRADDSNQGGDGGGGGGEGEKTPPKNVDPAEHDRALSELNKVKAKAAKLEADLKAAADAKLKEQNDWKTLAEQKEEEAKAAKLEVDNIKTSLVNEKKESAVRAAAEKLGIRPEAMADL